MHDAVTLFEHAVKHYSSTGFYGTPADYDFSRFPTARNGFCTFSNVNHLISALPYRLSETKHTYGLNCFDTVILLANDHLRTRLKPDEHVGKFVVMGRTTNHVAVLTEVATAREAFTNTYPIWYREATEHAFPKALQETRTCLTAALFRSHSFHDLVKEESLDKSLLDALRKDCRLQKLSFPKSFELILCHQVDLPERTFSTTHAGLLFRRDKGYLYLEKKGGSGPFLRLDFEDRADLLRWLAAEFKGLEHEHTHVFATFNDAAIERLNIAR